MRIAVPLALVATITLVAQPQTGSAIRHINPPGLAVPGAYTHLVEATGGRTLYLAGQVALDRDRNVVGVGDFGAQARQVFENLRTALAAGGATFDDVVKMTMYVVDMSEIDALREIRTEFLGETRPANTLVQVVRLAREDFLLEVEAIAVLAE